MSKHVLSIHTKQNLVLAVVMGLIITVILLKVGFIKSYLWVAPAILVSFPIKFHDNRYSLWGGSSSGDCISLIGIYQDAGRDAVCLFGCSLFQRAGDNATMLCGFSLYQEAGFGTRIGTKVIGYNPTEHMTAVQWFTFSVIQRAALDARQIVGIIIFQNAEREAEQNLGISIYQRGRQLDRKRATINIFPGLIHGRQRH